MSFQDPPGGESTATVTAGVFSDVEYECYCNNQLYEDDFFSLLADIKFDDVICKEMLNILIHDEIDRSGFTEVPYTGLFVPVCSLDNDCRVCLDGLFEFEDGVKGNEIVPFTRESHVGTPFANDFEAFYSTSPYHWRVSRDHRLMLPEDRPLQHLHMAQAVFEIFKRSSPRSVLIESICDFKRFLECDVDRSWESCETLFVYLVAYFARTSFAGDFSAHNKARQAIYEFFKNVPGVVGFDTRFDYILSSFLYREEDSFLLCYVWLLYGKKGLYYLGNRAIDGPVSLGYLASQKTNECIGFLFDLFAVKVEPEGFIQLGLLALGEFVEELGPLSDFIGAMLECSSFTQALFIIRSTLRNCGLRGLVNEMCEHFAVQVAYFLRAISEVACGNCDFVTAFDFKLTPEQNFENECVSSYRRIISSFKKDQTEGPGEAISVFWSYVTHPAFVQTPLFKAFYEVVSNVSVSMPLRSLGIIDLATWEDLVKRHQSYFSCSANDFCAKIVNLVRLVLSNISDMIRYRDPTLLWGEYNYQSWLADASKLYQDGASDVEVKKGVFMPYTSAERVERMRGMISHGEKIQAKLISWKIDNVVVSSVAQMLRQLRDKVESEVVMTKGGSLRMTPYSVMLLGPPGVGKSTMVQRMADTLLSKIDFATGSSQVFVFKPGMKHMNGFRTQPIIWLDDVDKSVVSPSGDFQGHAVDFININNCLPYVSPQAELSDKGKYFVRPVATFYTTNHETCNIKGKITDPLPFWRRVSIRIIVHLREEFMKDPLSDRTIAPHKVTEGSNPYVYEIQRFHQLVDINSFNEAHMSTVGYIHTEAQMYSFLARDFEEHYTRERGTLDRMTGEGHCPTCHIPLAVHGVKCESEVKLDMGSQINLVRYIIPQNVERGFRRPAFPQGYGENWWNYFKSQFPVPPKESVQVYACGLLCLYVYPLVGIALISATYNRESIQDRTRNLAMPYITEVIRESVESTAFSFVKKSGFFKEKSDSTKNKVVNEIIHNAPVEDTALVTFDAVWEILQERVERVAKVATVGIGLLLVYRAFGREHAEPESRVPSESFPSLVNKGIRSIYAQPRPGDFSREWSIASDPVYSMSDVSATSSVDQIVSSLKKNVLWLCSPEYEGTDKVMYAIRLSGNMFLSTKHYFQNGGRFRYWSGDEGRSSSRNFCDLRVGKEVFLHPTKDLCVFHVVGIHPGGEGSYKHLVHSSQLALGKQFDRGVFIYPGNGVVPPTDYEVSPLKYTLPAFTKEVQDVDLPVREGWAYSVPSQKGWCGSPLVLKRQGHCWWGGIHVAASHGFMSTTAMGDEVTRFDVDPLILRCRDMNMTARLSQPVPVSQGCDAAGFEFSPVLWDNNPFNGAEKVDLEIVGSVEKIFGQNPHSAHHITKVVPTPFSQDFDDLRQRHLGQDYFCGPNFRGRLINGVWREPLLESIKACEGVFNMPKDELEMACDDYIEGVELLPGTDTFRVLSDEETLYGVEGSSIRGFDRTTSSGYPFFRNKTHLVDSDPVKGMSIVFKKQLEWARKMLHEGFLAMPFVSWSLKDEPLSAEKVNLKNKARVFMCFPFFFNFLLKQYFGPVMAFILMHRQFFECYAGMNVSSRECHTFYQHMSAFGTHNAFDADAEKWDKRLNTTIRVAVIEILVYLMRVLNYTDEQVRIGSGILVSELYHFAYCKGGLVAFSFTDPSGSFLTILHNSIGQSVMMRFVWRKYYAGYVFRDHVRLAHVGDDSLQCVADGFSAYCYVTVRDECKKYGVVFTPGDKSDAPDYFYKELEACSFLKRRLRWNSDLSSWVAVLDPKSLVKTLTVMIPGKTSLKDQMSSALSSVLREYFLYGRVEYEYMLVRVRSVCVKYEIWSGFIQTYDELRLSYGRDHFAVWGDSIDALTESC